MVYSVARRRGSDNFFRSRSGIRHNSTPLPRASLLGNTQSNGKSALFKCQVEKNRPEKPRSPPLSSSSGTAVLPIRSNTLLFT